MERFQGIPLSRMLQVTGLVSAFQYTFPADFQNPGERHDGWEFVYVKEGSLRIHAEDAVYLLKAGELVCHKPMEFHALQPAQDPTTAVILCFHCQGQAMSLFHNKILTVSHRQKLYFRDLVDYSKSFLLPKDPLQITQDGGMLPAPQATAAQAQCIQNTLELLLLSLMEVTAKDRQQRAELYEQTNLRKNLAADIMAYLEENMTSPVRLSDLTELFAYSLSSMKRIFKSETGFTIIDYQHHLRIRRAQQLLAETELSVETIAGTVGYSSVYYFSNVFKRRTGQTPSAYRHTTRK